MDETEHVDLRNKNKFCEVRYRFKTIDNLEEAVAELADLTTEVVFNSLYGGGIKGASCMTCEYNVFDSRNNRCAKCVDCSNHSAKELNKR